METPYDRSSNPWWNTRQQGISDLLIRVVLVSALACAFAGAADGHFARGALVAGAVVGAAFGAVFSTVPSCLDDAR